MAASARDQTGDRLRQLRIALGLTEADFADTTLLGSIAYRQVEEGLRPLDEGSLRRLVQTYSITREWLLCGDEQGL